MEPACTGLGAVVVLPAPSRSPGTRSPPVGRAETTSRGPTPPEAAPRPPRSAPSAAGTGRRPGSGAAGRPLDGNRRGVGPSALRSHLIRWVRGSGSGRGRWTRGSARPCVRGGGGGGGRPGRGALDRAEGPARPGGGARGLAGNAPADAALAKPSARVVAVMAGAAVRLGRPPPCGRVG